MVVVVLGGGGGWWWLVPQWPHTAIATTPHHQYHGHSAFKIKHISPTTLRNSSEISRWLRCMPLLLTSLAQQRHLDHAGDALKEETTVLGQKRKKKEDTSDYGRGQEKPTNRASPQKGRDD